MRVPRVHRFRTDETADALFRRLAPGRRFRFAPAGGPQVMGDEPVAFVAAGRNEPLPRVLSRLRDFLPRVPGARSDGLFPGGAVGWIGYEAGDAVEGLPPRAEGPGDPPDIAFAVVDTFAVWREGEVEIVSWGLEQGVFDGRLALRRAGELEERLRGPAVPPETNPVAGALRASLDRGAHGRAVESILEAIARGDVYQANLTVRFDAGLPGSGVPLFETLLRENPAPFAAFVEGEGATVISASPERMLAVDGRRVESRPIKGTTARDPDPALDRARADALLHSEKDRAELLMITDLLRNDLGKVCEYASVRVPRLREVESFPHLHHLVSTIAGRLRPGLDALDALAAVFPCGSITGAPKRRAMQLLRELEPAARGPYTGTVGWVGFDRSADFSVAIRTGWLRDGVLSFGSGGGIVADSDPDAEWDELLLKARAMRAALGAEEPAGMEKTVR
ncbi:MAG: aminodeoxychorismate synthase component I [Candidatus Eiseniibacteriota bacterium]